MGSIVAAQRGLVATRRGTARSGDAERVAAPDVDVGDQWSAREPQEPLTRSVATGATTISSKSYTEVT